jgi:biotin carboxyl carrier protein
MKFDVEQNGKSRSIELRTAGGTHSIIVDGREYACDWLHLPGGRISLRMGNRIFDLALSSEGDHWLASGREGRQRIEVRDPRKLGRTESSVAGTAGLQRVTAEMPGKVIRVIVRKGDRVSCDQPLLVLEAMKMQNEIRAPKSGVICEVAAAEGKTVAAGEFLLSLE